MGSIHGFILLMHVFKNARGANCGSALFDRVAVLCTRGNNEKFEWMARMAVNSSSLAYLNYIFNVKRELNENELNSVKFILIKRNKKGELID